MEGFFAFDLLRMVELPFRPETWFLTIFCRDAVSGPQPLAVITKDLLPPGAK